MRFILIDELTEITKGKRASARKVFDASEPFFADHFPGFPIVPGVLLSEAMSQTGGWLLLVTLDFGTFPLLNMIQSAKFRRPAAPGDELIIEAEIDRIETTSSRVKASVSVEGARIADAVLVFRHLDFLEEGERGAGLRDWVVETWKALSGGLVVGE